MSDYTTANIRIPPDYSDFRVSVEALTIPHLIVQDVPLQSVAEYSLTEHGNDFPRPTEHFVIADYLIDLPIIAVDLGADSLTYGRVIGYATGDRWLIEESLALFLDRLRVIKGDAVWGK